MAPTKPACVICRRKLDEEERVIPFTQVTLKKCNDVLRVRKIHNLKYNDILLPTDTMSPDGYHLMCYKPFTAVQKKYYDYELAESEVKRELSTPSPQPSTSTQTLTSPIEASTSQSPSGGVEMSEESQSSTSSNDNTKIIKTEREISSNACFFCDKTRKKHRGKMQRLHSTTRDSMMSRIKKYLENAEDMIQKLEESTMDTLFYHEKCNTDLYNHRRSSQNTIRTAWHAHRDYHKMAYGKMCEFIDENIVQQGSCYFLSCLHRYYISLLKDVAEDNYDSFNSSISPQHLETKLLTTFKYVIRSINKHNRKIIVPKQIVDVDERLFYTLKEAEDLQKNINESELQK
ncbi:hypothetical protein JTB14_005075 [Gonioctena quinquepunctata]|nr:hypothetical protein JTB14_005075 [Gonioctena quinquepunctata]